MERVALRDDAAPRAASCVRGSAEVLDVAEHVRRARAALAKLHRDLRCGRARRSAHCIISSAHATHHACARTFARTRSLRAPSCSPSARQTRLGAQARRFGLPLDADDNDDNRE
jgi:hypothetical protein